MAQYMITYLGGSQPSSPEQGKKHFARYKDWLQSMGESVVSPANPLKNTCTIHADGSVTKGGMTSMSGFTIIKADSIEAAQDKAKTCPFLDLGGSLEVSELIQMTV